MECLPYQGLPIADVEKTQTGWLEPAEEWIKEAENLPNIANGQDLFLKKVAAKKVFGSNLILSNRKIRLKPQNVPQIQWAALAAAQSQIGKMETCNILVGEVGVEPTRPCGHTVLSGARIPVPPLARVVLNSSAFAAISQTRIASRREIGYRGGNDRKRCTTKSGQERQRREGFSRRA